MKARCEHRGRSERNGVTPRLGGAVGMLREVYLGRDGLAKKRRASREVA